MTNHPPVQDFATDFDHTDPKWVADPYPIWDSCALSVRSRTPIATGVRGCRRRTRVSPRSRTTPSTSRSRSVVVSELRPDENDLPAPIGIAPPITSDPPFHQLARRILLPSAWSVCPTCRAHSLIGFLFLTTKTKYSFWARNNLFFLSRPTHPQSFWRAAQSALTIIQRVPFVDQFLFHVCRFRLRLVKRNLEPICYLECQSSINMFFLNSE